MDDERQRRKAGSDRSEVDNSAMEINKSELSEVPKTDDEALESRPTKKVKKGAEKAGEPREDPACC